jgi:pilus assembly protein Flp/PilA
MARWFLRLWGDESGPTAVEYALMITLLAVAIIAGAQLLGTASNSRFNEMANSLNNG